MIQLVVREIRNHGFTLAGVGGFVLLMDLLVLATHRIKGGDMSAFDPLILAGVPVTLVVCSVVPRRLVAHDRQQKTLAFLEALPVERSAVIAVKLALGFLVVWAVMAFQVALFGALGAPSPDASLALRVLARMVLFGTYAAGVGFALASLGRYFGVSLAAAFLVTTSLETFGEELSRVGPFGLVARTFTTDRGPLPLGASTWATLGALAGVGLCVWLWCARSGSLSSALFERMSHREGMRWAGGFLVATLLIHAEKDRCEHFALPGATVRQSGGVTVELGADVERAVDAPRAEVLDRTESALRTTLGWTGARSLPAVAIVARGDVPTGRAAIEYPSDGAVLVALRGATVERLVATSVQAAALGHTRELVRREETAWVLDGAGVLAARWGRVAATLDRDEDLLVPMLAALREPVTARDLVEWRTFRERVGDECAEAVAYSLLRAVALVRGPQAVTAMLRAAFDRPFARSLLGLAGVASMRQAWRAAGITPEEAIAAWSGRVEALRRARADAIGRVARVEARVRADRVSEVSRALTLTLGPGAAVGDDAALVAEVWRLSPESVALEKGTAPGEPAPGDLAWRGDVTGLRLREGVRVPATFTRGEVVLWRLRAAGVMTGYHREVLP